MKPVAVTVALVVFCLGSISTVRFARAADFSRQPPKVEIDFTPDDPDIWRIQEI